MPYVSLGTATLESIDRESKVDLGIEVYQRLEPHWQPPAVRLQVLIEGGRKLRHSAFDGLYVSLRAFLEDLRGIRHTGEGEAVLCTEGFELSVQSSAAQASECAAVVLHFGLPMCTQATIEDPMKNEGTLVQIRASFLTNRAISLRLFIEQLREIADLLDAIEERKLPGSSPP